MSVECWFDPTNHGCWAAEPSAPSATQQQQQHGGTAGGGGAAAAVQCFDNDELLSKHVGKQITCQVRGRPGGGGGGRECSGHSAHAPITSRQDKILLPIHRLFCYCRLTCVRRRLVDPQAVAENRMCSVLIGSPAVDACSCSC